MEERTTYTTCAIDNEQEPVWPIPLPIEKAFPPVDPLPEGILPDALEPWLRDIAHRMQAPVEFLAVTVITMISSIVGANIGIKPKRKDDWLVIPNLWGMCIGPPSMLKTPTMNEVLKAVKKLETEATENYKTQIREWKAQKEIRKLDAEKAKKEYKSGDMGAEARLQQLLVGNEEDEPTQKRFISNDATIEKLGVILNDNPTGVLVFRDELAGLLASWERAGHEQDRAFYLEAWNGYGSYQVDRIGRESLFIPNLCLSVLGGIQPSKLAGYFHNLSEFGNDGAIQRFQLAVYPDAIPNRQYVDEYPSKEAREKAYNLIRVLTQMDYQNLKEADSYDERPYLRFDDQAQELFREWYLALEKKLSSGELSPLMEEHLAKYRSLLPSLALLFHLIDIASQLSYSNKVSLGALHKAIRFTNFLLIHARRIYSIFGNSTQQATYELSKRIINGKIKHSLTIREVTRKGWHLLSKTEDVTHAVRELVEAGWLVEQQRFSSTSGLGGRPATPEYLINPHCLDMLNK